MSVPTKPTARFFGSWRRYVATVLWLLASAGAGPMTHAARRLELGYPEIKIYPTGEIDAPVGSEFVAKDRDGRIIFSSQGELSAYDGVTWKRISDPGNRPKEDFLAVHAAANGQLLACGIAFWGEIRYDERGRYVAHSFVPPELEAAVAAEAFNTILRAGETVYYVSSATVARWSPTAGSRLWTTHHIDTAFLRDGTLHFAVRDEGIYRIVGDDPVLVEGSEMLYAERSIPTRTCEWFDGRTAFSSTRSGLILFDGARFDRIATDLDQAESELWTSDMLMVNDEFMAISIKNEGVAFMTPTGDIAMMVDETLDYRFLDCGDLEKGDDGSVWVTVADGVAKILYPNLLTFFDRRQGLELDWYDLCRHRDALYIWSSGTLVKAQYDDANQLRGFESVLRNPKEDAWDALSLESGLLVSTSLGLRLLRDDGTDPLIGHGVKGLRLLALHSRPGMLVAAGGESVVFFRIEGEGIHIEETVPYDGLPNKIAEDANGDLWLERGFSRIDRIARSEGGYVVERYGVEDGLTSDQWIPIWKYGKDVRFSSRKGVLKFNRSARRFETDKEINRIIPARIHKLTRPALDNYGNLWVAALDGNLVLRRQPDGSFTEDNATLQSLGNYQIDEFRFDQDDIVWLLSQKTLARLDDSRYRSVPELPEPLVYQVSATRNAEILFHNRRPPRPENLEVEYRNNDISFAFSTPYYLTGRRLAHRYKLEGFMDDWAVIEESSEAQFTNLPEGSYVLKLQAVTDSGHRSTVSNFPFAVNPPIYRTFPAYLAYAISSFALLYTFVKLRHIKLIARQRDLERQVDEQTRELLDKNLQLEAAVFAERELKQRAEQANKAKGEFLAMVSHEIRTPMNCIVGMTDNLLDTPLLGEQQDMVKAIHTSGHSLVTIISDILDYSKIEAGKIDFERIPIDTRSLALDVMTMFEHSCREKGIELVAKLNPDLPRLVMGDPIRIKQVLINLVGNALKFTESGSIRIELDHAMTGSNKALLRFAVSDSGIGIDASKMDLLFQSFSQVDSSNTRKYGGTGLGLAICKRLVGMMGGEIRVESVLGEGSTFSFTVPACLPTSAEREGLPRQSPRPATPPPRRTYDALPHTKPTVGLAIEARDALLVEDNPINQQVTAMMLRRLGFTCDILDNGRQAADAVARKGYKFILMDIQMPEMDGIECAQSIRARLGQHAPPIIAVTAKSADRDRELAAQAGMSGYLTKPLDRNKLRQEISRLVPDCEGALKASN